MSRRAQGDGRDDLEARARLRARMRGLWDIGKRSLEFSTPIFLLD